MNKEIFDKIIAELGSMAEGIKRIVYILEAEEKAVSEEETSEFHQHAQEAWAKVFIDHAIEMTATISKIMKEKTPEDTEIKEASTLSGAWRFFKLAKSCQVVAS